MAGHVRNKRTAWTRFPGAADLTVASPCFPRAAPSSCRLMAYGTARGTSASSGAPPPRRGMTAKERRLLSDLQAQEDEELSAGAVADGFLASTSAASPSDAGEMAGQPVDAFKELLPGVLKGRPPRVSPDGTPLRGRPVRGWSAKPASQDDASEPDSAMVAPLGDRPGGADDTASGGGLGYGVGGALAAWQPKGIPPALRPEIYEQQPFVLPPDLVPRNIGEVPYLEEQLAQAEWFGRRTQQLAVAHRAWRMQHDQGPRVVNRYALARRIAGEMSKFENNDFERGALSPSNISSYARAEIVFNETFDEYNSWLKTNIEDILKQWPDEMRQEEIDRLDDVVFLVPREETNHLDQSVEQAQTEEQLAQLYLEGILPHVSLYNLGASFANEIFPGSSSIEEEDVPIDEAEGAEVQRKELEGAMPDIEEEGPGQRRRRKGGREVDRKDGFLGEEEEEEE